MKRISTVWMATVIALLAPHLPLHAQESAILWMKGIHNGRITALDYLGSKRLLASGSADSTVRLWDGATGHYLRRIDVKEIVTSVDLSGNGARVLVGDTSGRVVIWNRGTGLIEREIARLDVPVTAAFFLPDGKRLLYAGGEEIVIATTSGTIEKVVPLSSPLRALILSDDGSTIAFAHSDGGIFTLDTAMEAQPIPHPLTGRLRNIVALAFSPDGNRLAMAGDGGAGFHNNASSQTNFIADLTVKALALSADDTTSVIFGTVQSILSIDLSSGKSTPIAWVPDLTVLACDRTNGTIISGNNSGEIRVWRKDGSGEERSITINGWAVSVSADGGRVAASNRGREIIVWDAMTGETILDIPAANAFTVTLSPDGRSLATTRSDTVIIHDIPSGSLAGALGSDSLQLLFDALRFLPDGRLMNGRFWVSSTGFCSQSYMSMTTLRLHEAPSGSMIRVLKENRPAIEKIAIDEDGKGIVTSGPYIWCDGGMKHYPLEYIDIENGTILPPFPQAELDIEDVAITSNGPLVATVDRWRSTKRILLWDPRMGVVVDTLDTSDAAGGPVTVAFLGSGRYVAAGGKRGLIRIFDVKSGEVIGSFSEYRREIIEILAPRSLGHFVTRGEDGTIIVWSTSSLPTEPLGVDHIAMRHGSLRISAAPNPATGLARIELSLRSAGNARITLVGIDGREAATIFDGDLPEGEHAIEWDATTVPPGIYLCLLKSGGEMARCKISVTR